MHQLKERAAVRSAFLIGKVLLRGEEEVKKEELFRGYERSPRFLRRHMSALNQRGYAPHTHVAGSFHGR